MPPQGSQEPSRSRAHRRTRAAPKRWPTSDDELLAAIRRVLASSPFAGDHAGAEDLQTHLALAPANARGGRFVRRDGSGATSHRGQTGVS